ncbi:MAG TPA: glycosyltransferase, partial [Candidatus Thermoplasmatota archaeon]|nr:glycosyltransferase [Candidatus Thermoplasmatota archaeon]
MSGRSSRWPGAGPVLAAVVFAFYLLLDGFALIEGLAFANALKAVALGSLLAVVLLRRPTLPTGRALLAIAILLVVLAESLVLVPFSEVPRSALWGSFAFAVKGPLVLFLFYQCARTGLLPLERALRIWIVLGCVFALQAVLHFLLVYALGLGVPVTAIDLPRLGGEDVPVSPFGFFSASPRAQGFFVEATKLGHFLAFPLFASLVTLEGRRRTAAFGLLLAGSLVTMNLVVLAALAAAFAAWRILRLPRRSHRVAAGAAIGAALALAGAVVWQNEVFDYAGDNTLLNAIATRQASIEDKKAQILQGIALANERPFGVGMTDPDISEYGADGFNTANALFKILAESGWFGLALHAVLWTAMVAGLLRAADRARAGRGPQASVALGVGYFALLAMGATYGPYTDNVFVLSLVLTVVAWQEARPTPPPEPVRVLHVLPSSKGGAAEHVRLLAQFADKGFDLSVALPDDDGNVGPEDFPRAAVLPIRAFSAPLPAALAEIRRLALEGGYHVIHLHGTRAAMLGRLALLDAREPRVVHTIHGYHIARERGPKAKALLKAERLLAFRSDAVVCLTVSDAGVAEHHGTARVGRIHVVPNGIDAQRFAHARPRAQTRAALGLPEGAFVVMMVARLHPPKDFETLLRGFAILARDDAKARLVLVGDGPLRDAVLRQAAALGVEGRVLLLGVRRDVPDL